MKHCFPLCDLSELELQELENIHYQILYLAKVQPFQTKEMAVKLSQIIS